MILFYFYILYKPIKAPGDLQYYPIELFIEFENSKFGCDIDIWAVGVVLYEMIMLENPFCPADVKKKKNFHHEIQKRVTSLKYKPVEGSVAADEIIQGCFKLRKDRPKATDLLQHPKFVHYIFE